MATKKTTKATDQKNLLAEIEKRAFEIYIDRKHHNRPGDETDDWYQAEKEIREKHQSAS
jgi:Protein of unknown function (DUF2934)